MNPLSRQLLLPALLALALCPFQPQARAASPDKPAVTFADPVVATGKGFTIKRSQLDEAFVNYNTTVAANGGSIPEEQRTMVKSNLLQHLIVTQILLQMATPDEKAKTTKVITDNIDEARRTAPSPAAFDAQIKASGMTLDQVRARAYEEQLCRRVLERETTNGISISDAAAKKFYDENTDKFEVPEQVRVTHILISTMDPVTQQPLVGDQKKAKEQLAKEIKARADKGEDFVKLVKQYSDDPGSREKGGEYKFPRGQMVPEFEAAAFTLKINQISDPVETRFGYHIIKLLEKFPPKKETFPEVELKIKAYLVSKEAEKILPKYLDKIETEAHVALFDPETGKQVPFTTK